MPTKEGGGIQRRAPIGRYGMPGGGWVAPPAGWFYEGWFFFYWFAYWPGVGLIYCILILDFFFLSVWRHYRLGGGPFIFSGLNWKKVLFIARPLFLFGHAPCLVINRFFRGSRSILWYIDFFLMDFYDWLLKCTFVFLQNFEVDAKRQLLGDVTSPKSRPMTSCAPRDTRKY